LLKKLISIENLENKGVDGERNELHKGSCHAARFRDTGMKDASILVIGGGIGGLTSAIALRQKGFKVDVIERDPTWSVYGVGIIQQSNVVRAMSQLGVLDSYLHAGFGFDHVEIFLPSGQRVARVPTPNLAEGYPANVGISRRALHDVLGAKAIAAGADIRLGVVATSFDNRDDGVAVHFSDGSQADYDIVVAADGIYSQTRCEVFPDAPLPEFAGQSVWRYNFKRDADLDALRSYEGSVGVGLVPIAGDLMYMFVTTPEEGDGRYPRSELAAVMRSKLEGVAPDIARLANQITDNDAVVYRPLERIFISGDWHKGRIVLLGDAVHATTPHLGQGAGMAIEDSIVLAEELAKAESPDAGFRAYRERRVDRCRYIVEASMAICDSQLKRGPHVDQATAVREMFEVTSQPI
jgi:2-polyprenyl-6-methoxyphenol hydroxylase-like FAD-dependent oxidoreductase